MRLTAPPRLGVFLASLLVLGCLLPACAPGAAFTHGMPTIDWQPDDDARLSYGILLLDQALRDDDPELVLEAGKLLAHVSPSPRPFVDAAAWLLLNRAPQLARQVLEPAVVRFPDELNLHLLMAEAWLEEKKPEQAVSLMQAYVASHKESAQSRQELGVLYTKAERHQDAVTTFEGLPLPARTPFVRYCYAKSLAALDRNAEAIRELREAVREAPEFVEAWSDLGRLLEARKEYRQAAAIYEHILEQEPSSQDTWIRLITTYIEDGDRRSALEVAKNYQDSLGLAFSAAALFLDRKLYTEAGELLNVIRRNPETPSDVYFYLAVVAYEGRKNSTEALTLLEQVKPGANFYDRSLRFRVQLLFESGNTDAALALLLDARKLSPGEPTLALLQIHILSQDKQLDTALHVADEAVGLWPDDPDIAYARGMTLDLAGREDDAMLAMEKLVTSRPDYFQALNYIGYALAEQGRDLPRALKLLREADRLSPDTAHILDSLAWAEYRSGQYDTAWSYIIRAVRLEGGQDALIWEHYGDIAAARGQRADAHHGYTNALRQGHEHPDTIRRKMEKP